MGLEPATCWLQISCSANWATPAQHFLYFNTNCDRCQHFFEKTQKVNGRGYRIWTCGPLVPNQVRYQTALNPDQLQRVILYTNHFLLSIPKIRLYSLLFQTIIILFVFSSFFLILHKFLNYPALHKFPHIQR